MPAYFIFLRESPVRDPEAMLTYLKEGRSALSHPDLTPLAGYGELIPVEGAAPDGAVILEFPDVASARAWYDSEDYQKVVALRLKAADYRGFIIDGLPPRETR